ncbi:34446_t:CDS:2, partial [Racocetra persica]
HYVEEELYKLGKKLEYEHAAHSFILDLEDETILNHFSYEEILEIEHVPGPLIPELDEKIIECLSKFVGKTNLKEIRSIIKEISFDNQYNFKTDHDIDYIVFALHAMVREMESDKLHNNNLEAWYNAHIWSFIFDQAFSNINIISVVRGESSGIASSIRKNKNRNIGQNRKMGSRGDWFLRSNGDNDEYGAGEAGKSWQDKYGTKFVRESGVKLPKSLKDIIVKLLEKVEWNSEKRNQIQTVGIVHEGMSFIHMSN